MKGNGCCFNQEAIVAKGRGDDLGDIGLVDGAGDVLGECVLLIERKESVRIHPQHEGGQGERT